MLQALAAEQRERKENVIIMCKRIYIPFHMDQFHSDWIEKRSPLTYILDLKMGILHFPLLAIIDKQV